MFEDKNVCGFSLILIFFPWNMALSVGSINPQAYYSENFSENNGDIGIGRCLIVIGPNLFSVKSAT